jgi:effector-binding domain-containing protein
MDIQIITIPLHKIIHGCSAVAVNNDFAGTGVKLMNAMKTEVKRLGLKNKGVNIWLYEKTGMTAGVELEEAPKEDSILQRKEIKMLEYAYYKHIGPYSKLHQTFIDIQAELKRRGISVMYPFLEVYGEWEEDENQLVTELYLAIRH